MEVAERARLEVSDDSAVGRARRIAVDLAREMAFGEVDVGRLGIVVTEAGTNLVKHAGGGELLLRGLEHDGLRGIGVLALDRGPGVASLGDAMRDGFSSSGTPGTGLGAIRRQSTLFDAYSTPGLGLALLSTVWPKVPAAEASGVLSGGINVAYPGEEVSGDAWLVRADRDGVLALVCDGLGHGPDAAAASALASAIFRRNASGAPGFVLERIHEALRSTRGAAVAVTEIDRARGLVRFAGIGNIAGTILANGTTRSVVSHHGTAGHDARRIQEFTYPWEADALLVLHSDGLVSRWTLERYPGLASRHPMLTAAVLYRDFRRGRDDTSVVVLRNAP
jgi:anti-sigma regulatory factor (Ser/Thr protein kinase)